MKKILLIGFLLLISQFSFSQITNSQDSIYIVKTVHGREFIGKILTDDAREILIETENMGKLFIPKSDVVLIVLLTEENQLINGEYNESSPFSTRYAFTTNALPIEKGQNYAMLNLYGPEVHFAVSDNLNIGIMSTWIGSPIALAAKYSFQTKDPLLNFSIGGILGHSGYLSFGSNAIGGLYFANTTYGTRKSNVTFGVGFSHFNSLSSGSLITPGNYYYDANWNLNYNYQNTNPPSTYGPVISFGAITKIGGKASLVLDFLYGRFKGSSASNSFTPIFDQNTGNIIGEQVSIDYVTSNTMNTLLMMPGIRIQGKENSAFQFNLSGLYLNSSEDNAVIQSVSIPFPMASWFYKF